MTPFDASPRTPGLWKKFLLGSLAIVLLSTTAAAAAVLLEVKHVADLIGPATLQTSAGVITPAQAGKAETILVLGTDARKLSKDVADRTNPPHSDTLLLIRMDPSHHQTSELSIPRDLKTTITTAGGAVTTQKINAAYTLGGVSLAAKTIESTLPGIQINHIVAVNFAGFRKLIDAIGCVYVFVDRHYYNLNLGTVATDYSSIDIQPGYQQLCGQPALDYVRYRHTDSDFVRVARQQDFVRQAKQQIGVQGPAQQGGPPAQGAAQRGGDRHPRNGADLPPVHAGGLLARPADPAGDLPDDPNVLIGGGSYVVASPAQIQATVSDFLNGNPPSKITVPTRQAGGGDLGEDGRRARPDGDPGRATSAWRTSRRSACRSGCTSRACASRARRGGRRAGVHAARRAGVKHAAYVISIARGLVGEYYGVEGTNWLDPPILAGTHQTRKLGGRTYGVYLDGSHIRRRLVACGSCGLLAQQHRGHEAHQPPDAGDRPEHEADCLKASGPAGRPQPRPAYGVRSSRCNFSTTIDPAARASGGQDRQPPGRSPSSACSLPRAPRSGRGQARGSPADRFLPGGSAPTWAHAARPGS